MNTADKFKRDENGKVFGGQGARKEAVTGTTSSGQSYVYGGQGYSRSARIGTSSNGRSYVFGGQGY